MQRRFGNQKQYVLGTPSISYRYIQKKAAFLLSKYNFDEKFYFYCTISLQIRENQAYILVKFPQKIPRENCETVYFPENNSFPISDALLSGEILHNNDLNFKGRHVRYNLSPSKVKFFKQPQSKVSLIVSIMKNTFESYTSSVITERRGNKDITGLIRLVKIHKVMNSDFKYFNDISMDIVLPTARLLIGRMPIMYECRKMQASFNFLIENHFDIKYFDSYGNRCYCKECFPTNWINSQVVGNETYIIPRNWTRFGLKTSKILSAQNEIWNKWCNAFHGTNLTAARSIIEHRTLLLNKDIKQDGNRLGKNCSADEYNKYFLSPHICYSSHPWYSRITQIEPRNGKKRYAQLVFACKVRYGIFKKQKETEGGAKRIFDDYSIIPYNEIEWYSDRRGCVIPYGVLIRLFGETKRREVERLDYDIRTRVW